ncbi:MAG: iron-sulfur cluster carrier protein ApbC [Bacteroidetes bacterium]|nr:MAG: iron-sulfur cluster carrier protein ApbC [Bacteroidota bacterium]TAG85522.1 MAG: iron-sulfur cluster carrier protein ApbC [Bacteroidota bacterium]
MTEKDILKALSTVEEPDLKKDLVTLGMIKNIQITANRVRFTVVLTTPACPLKELIRQRCENAIHTQVDKNAEIEIEMTAEVTSIRNQGQLLPQVKNIIAIASGKGGVGKSTITANLALALSRTGAKVGIIDADISGPSIPIMFGVENEKPYVRQENGKNWIIPIERFDIKIISMGFLAPSESAVAWRGPMASKALMQFLGDTDWGYLDYLLIDLPPGTGDIHISLTQALPLTGAVIVTTPQKVALADALKGVAMFRQPGTKVPILGLVENMAYFTPAELPQNKYYIFGQDGGKKFAENNVLSFLGQIPLVQSIRESGDIGIPAVANAEPATMEAFEELARNVAQQIAIVNAEEK